MEEADDVGDDGGAVGVVRTIEGAIDAVGRTVGEDPVHEICKVAVAESPDNQLQPDKGTLQMQPFPLAEAHFGG